MNLESFANIIYHLMGAWFFFLGAFASARLVNILPNRLVVRKFDADLEVPHDVPPTKE